MEYGTFLNKLQRLRSTGNNTWRAFCPAHDSNSHSLSLAVADDGRLLVKCHVGCGAIDVLQAVGCDYRDLYPESERNLRSLARAMEIKPRDNNDDRIVELARHTVMTDRQREEAKRAALRGGKPDGFAYELADNLPENKEHAQMLLAAERELLKAEMSLGQDWSDVI